MNVLKNILEFLIFTVGLKMIVGHWIAEKTVKLVTKESTRNMTIWQHWMSWAKGQGHTSDNILNCSDGNCATL